MRFPCVRCRRTLTAPDQLIGQYVICVHCNAGNDVPEPPPIRLDTLLPVGLPAGSRCVHCGYRLGGLVENLCPECGRRFDPLWAARAAAAADAREPKEGRIGEWLLVAGAAVLLVIFLCSAL